MKFGKLVTLSAAALFAAGISIAAAQSNMGSGSKPSGGMAQPQGQCWDAASNSIKDKSGSPSGAKTPGGVTTGSSPSGQASNSKGTGDSMQRPANARNLPNC